jgi:pyruvate,water dikinase
MPQIHGIMQYIKSFLEVGMNDVALVGGKNASLGELCRNLTTLDIQVPCGFAVTIDGYNLFLKQSGIQTQLEALFTGLHPDNVESLQQLTEKARLLILEAEIPKAVVEEVRDAYDALLQRYGPDTHVAVRSSAAAEDMAEASFAGQYESFLNIHGFEELILTIRKCYASLYGARAIKYQLDRGLSINGIGISVGIQTMIRADLACSGVCFTVDPDTGFSNVVVITGAWGLGDNIVQGKVEPDEFHVFKPSLIARKHGIIRKRKGAKAITLGYASIGVGVENRPTSKDKCEAWVLRDDELELLANWSMRVEQHYGKPMDIEWAKDGYTNELYIVQARPETVHARRDRLVLLEYRMDKKYPAICEGQAVGTDIASGRARVLKSIEEAGRIKSGDVLVAETTTPDWDVVMKKASAVVTDHGGRTSHAAIVARELGVAAIVGATRATELIRDGDWITVNCTEGKVGKVHNGKIPWVVTEHHIDKIPQTKTAPMLVLSDPDKAYEWSFFPNQGVGLMRLEFLIAKCLKIHPMALTHFDRIGNPEERERINTLTKGNRDKASYFVENLAQGIATMAAAFYPKDVIVRFSDFKSNEYASLLGGAAFEVHEENPMIGFRGASRYYHERYSEGFALECKAIDHVRRYLGLTNVKVMIPFCRTVRELLLVLEEMARYGLVRGVYGLEVYMMIEVPSNAIEAAAFAKHVDGFSIGSNDLTQLTLGIDRDSSLIAPLFNERDSAVEWMISRSIRVAHEHGLHIGLCGQAPSDDPSFVQFLVDEGIDSISFNPDALIRGIESIHEAELNLPTISFNHHENIRK